jgi:hypothetical protein
MPLRDHFRPPVSRQESWTSFHAMWAAVIVLQLKKQLPAGYTSSPNVQLGTFFERDIGAYESGHEREFSSALDSGGVTATATAVTTWAVSEPTLFVDSELDEEAAFEVKIYDRQHDRTLVAVIEIVSPSNKDREENRIQFTAKCAEFLKQGVAVTIIDIVTVRSANLYTELMKLIRHPDNSMADAPMIYVTTTRNATELRKPKLQSWANRLAIGQPLPPIPIWLSSQQVLTFDLEQSYEKTCSDLSIT